MKKKLALIVGLNYAGTSYALNGCLNDARDLKKKLAKKGWDCNLLLEGAANLQAIESNLVDMFSLARSGDSIWVSNSSHGTQIADDNNDERDWLDEAIVCWDGHRTQLLLDDRIWKLCKQKSPGVQMVWFSDACFGGGGMRLMSSFAAGQPRFVHLSRIASDLSEPVPAPSTDRSFEGVDEDKTPWPFLWLAGSQETQTCADAWVNGRPCGIFTHIFLEEFNAAPPGVTYADLYKRVLTKLPSRDYPQIPLMKGSFKNAKVFS